MKYLLLFLAVLFVGCSQKMPEPIVKTVTVTKIAIQKDKIPSSLLDTKPLPKVPKNIKLQSQVSAYIIDLYNSASSCKANIKSIKEWNK